MARIKSITSKTIHADHWEPHEAVVIRSLNTEDEEIIADGLAGLDANGSPKLYAGRNKRLTLQRGIVSWTLTDEHGHRLPVDEQSIKNLHPVDSKYILDEINALGAPMSEAEKKDLPMPATDSIAAKDQPHNPA